MAGKGPVCRGESLPAAGGGEGSVLSPLTPPACSSGEISASQRASAVHTNQGLKGPAWDGSLEPQAPCGTNLLGASVVWWA